MHRMLSKNMLLFAFLSLIIAPSLVYAVPKIRSPAPEFNFGQKESGLHVEATFEIHNDGDQPLEIIKAIPGCSCTSAKVADKTIAPGGETTLKAILSLKQQKGDLRKQVTIQTNDPETPLYNVYITGTAVLPISVKPEKVFFGQVDAHAGETRTIELTAPTPEKAFHIVKLDVGDPNALSARYEEIEKDKTYKVYVTLSKQITPGDFHSYVRIHTSNPQVTVVGAAITATVAGEVAVKPSDIKVLTPKDKGGLTTYIAVSPGKVSSFQITGVDSPSPAIQTQVVSMGQSIYRIKITGLTPDKELDNKVILIKTDVKEMPEIRVPIHIINQGHPPITTQPSRPQQAGKTAPTTRPAQAPLSDEVDAVQ